VARHSQVVPDVTCKNCRDNNCRECLDTLRLQYTDERLCSCPKSKHDQSLLETLIVAFAKRQSTPTTPTPTAK